MANNSPNIGMDEVGTDELDTLSPEYQGMLERVINLAASKNTQGLTQFVKSKPVRIRQQLLQDAIFVLQNNKVYLVQALFGLDAVRRLSREQKNLILELTADSKTHGSLNQALRAIDKTLHVPPTVDLAQWQKYAAPIRDGLMVLNGIIDEYRTAEYAGYLKRFQGWSKEEVTTLRNKIKHAASLMHPNEPVPSEAIEELKQVLVKVGFTQQQVTELARRENQHRLLEIVSKLYPPLAIVERHFGDQAAQATALRERASILL